MATKRLRRRKLPVKGFHGLTPDATMVGGALPYIWIGSKERGVLCVITKPAQMRKWVKVLTDMLEAYERPGKDGGR